METSMYIIPGPSSQVLAGNVARSMQCRLAGTEFFRFPDGEQYLCVPDTNDNEDHVVIIQSTPADSDYIALLQLIDACDAAGRIDVVIPYFGYARQDRRFKSGESVSARALARAITADRVFTINVHNRGVLQYFDADATDLDAAPAIGAHLASMKTKTDKLDSPVIIAPDKGAIDLVRSVAEYLDADFDYIEKTRHSGDNVTIKTKKLDVSGKDAVILDDIISTGGTIVKTSDLLRENGADRVFVACVHPVLARNAATRIFSAGIEGIMATDTLDRSVSGISVAQLIADAI